MKANLHKKIVTGLLCVLCSAASFAQDLSGDWLGLLNSDLILSGKFRWLSLKIHLDQNGRKVKGTFSIALPDYPENPYAAFSISGLASKKKTIPASLMRDRILIDNLPAQQAEIFLAFDDIRYLKNDTAEFLYGNWLPNGAPSSRPDGAGGTFWVKRIRSTAAPPPDTIHKTYAARTTTIADTFRCSTPVITLSVYDNGEIDGDSVAVYVNDMPLVQHQLITAKPVIISLPVEKGKRYTISLFAENLGRIPPNTTLLKIEAGNTTKELRLSSTLDTNAAVIIDVQ